MNSFSAEGARFSPRPTRSRAFCSVYGCFTRASTEPTVRFHTFPKPGEGLIDVINQFGVVEKIDKLRVWKLALKIRKEVSPSMKVCSLHFTKDDYILPDIPAKRRCLKKSAIPWCNIPNEQTIVENRTIDKNHDGKVDSQNEWDVKDGEAVEIVYANDKNSEATAVTDVEKFYPSFVEIGTTTLEQSSSFTFRCCIETCQQLHTLTGIESFQILDRIVNIVHSVNSEITNSKSNLKENIVMTFLKLKQNLSYKSLAILCRISSARKCERIFNRMLVILSECLKPAIYWPAKTEICSNIPKNFKGFEGVRIVSDCIEIKIEKSKNLSCKFQKNSPYKKDSTIKFLIGFTSAGIVSFISEPYGGRMSHKDILENCNLIKKMDRYDYMIIDKRFIANDFCKDRKTKFIAKVISANGQKHLSTSYTLLIAKDPKLGEHIERKKQTIKSFKILNDRLPTKLIEKSRDIITIICATVNMSFSILKHYKFEL